MSNLQRLYQEVHFLLSFPLVIIAKEYATFNLIVQTKDGKLEKVSPQCPTQVSSPCRLKNPSWRKLVEKDPFGSKRKTRDMLLLSHLF